MQQTIEILEKKGYLPNEDYKCNNIKMIINQVLEKSKKGTKLEQEDMVRIRTNLENCDHSDMVKIDQCLTREQNLSETEYQWGSLVMNAKWKMI